VLGRPRRECDDAAGPEHAQHFLRRDLGTRREHVPELAHHDVERAVGERERLDVAFFERHVELHDGRVLTRSSEELRREIEATDVRAEPSRGERHDARSATDVEDASAARDARMTHERRRDGRRHHLGRREGRPGLLRVLLESSDRIRHFGTACPSTHL
jgi:hypothetical protein